MINISGIDSTFAMLSKLDKSLSRDAVVAVTDDVYNNVKKFAAPHYKTGVMEDNIEKRIKGDAGVVWINDKNMMVDWNGKKVNYASFVLFGTKAHKIKAKNKKALKWAGLAGFVKSVNHPGYKGDNFIDVAVKKTFNNLDNIYKGVLDGVK